MLRRRYGRIVNVASIGGKEGNARAPAYAASKGAVIALTKSLGKELIGSDVVANAICPAAVETELLQQMQPGFVQGLIAKIPMGRLGRPEEVGGLILYLSSPSCSFSTGAVFDCSGGRATY
jgi:3-oxoacyl-[acyl-carrier protein] reductase